MTHNTREWEEPLMHIMESYIMTAELGHLAKDQVKHKQELHAYYAELVDFVHQELQKARAEIRTRVIEELTTEINPENVQEGWERWWHTVEGKRCIEKCCECQNDGRILRAIDLLNQSELDQPNK